MDESKDQLQRIMLLDPRIEASSSRQSKYGVLTSGSEIDHQQYVASNKSNSQISWECNPPSRDTFIDRQLPCELKLLLRFEGTSGGAGIHLLQALGLPNDGLASSGVSFKDAPRCNPLKNVVSTLNLTVNSNSFTTNLNSYNTIMPRFNETVLDQNTSESMSPSAPDNVRDYSFGTGYNMNILGGYLDAVSNRGGYTRAKIIRNDSTGAPGDVALVELTITELLPISPLAYNKNEGDETALIHVSTMSVQMNFGGFGNGPTGGMMGALWSHSPDSGSVFTSTSVEVQSGTLFFTYITPTKASPVPKSISYNYYEPVLYPFVSGVPLAPGASTTIRMNPVTLATIPLMVYGWSSIQPSDRSITATDTFTRIDGMTVKFMNRSSIFSTMTPIDLYRMSVKNGLNVSYDQWTKHIGGVVCFAFGTDLALGPGLSPGLNGVFTFAVSLDITNLDAVPITPALNVLVISEGVLTVTTKGINRSMGVLTKEEILEAQREGAPSLPFKRSQNFVGSSFWDDVVKFFKGIARPAIDVAKMIVPPQYQGIVSGVDQFAKSQGLGLPPKGKGLIKGGSTRTGGAVMSRNDFSSY